MSDFGLKQTKNTLWNEASLSPDYKVCDNIDLDTIYLDFCSYYHMKFGKTPKVLRKIDGESNDTTRGKIIKTKSSENSMKPSDDALKKMKKEQPELNTDDLFLTSTNVVGEAHKNEKNIDTAVNIHRKTVDLFEQFSGEMRDLAAVIER